MKKLKNEMLLKSCRELYYEHSLSYEKIAQRLNLKYSRVRKILQNKITEPQLAFKTYAYRQKYKKLHQRARDDIKQLLLTSKHPVSIRNIQQHLLERHKLTTSRNMIWRYITTELNVSYRKILSIDLKQNYADAKLQR